MTILHRQCLAIAALLAGTVTFAQPVGEAKKYPHEHYFDFRGKPLPAEMNLSPKGSERFVKSEPEGLRITLPKKRGDLSPVIVGTRFAIQGDFEITATIEILEAEEPRNGFGVGATLFINKLETPAEGATIGRLLRPSGADVIIWDQGIGKKGEAIQYDFDSKPCKDKLFRLRLKRAGSQLRYQLGIGGTGESFEELSPKDFGPNEIKQVLVRITTGAQPCSVDVRLIDLRVRSGAVPATPVPAAVPEVEKSRNWLLAALCVALTLILVVAITLGALLFRRSRNRADGATKQD